MKVNRSWLLARCGVFFKRENENADYVDWGFDPESLAWIHAQVQRDNVWAWFHAHVQVIYGGLVAHQDVGACSYASEEDFRTNGPFKQMVDDGIDQLVAMLETLSLEHDLWEHDPITCVWCVARGISA